MSPKPPSLAGELPVDKVNDVFSRVDKNSLLIDDIVNQLVTHYCGELDDYIKSIKIALQDKNQELSNLELDNIIMTLPTLIYFTSEAQETLGIKEDVAKAIKSEAYNKTYQSIDKGTIPAKQAQAELECQSEIIAHLAYNRAYKKIKERLAASYEVLSSIKKVVTRRMEEAAFGRIDTGRTR